MEDKTERQECGGKYPERQKVVEKLQEGMRSRKLLATETLDAVLWQCVIAYQNYPFHTSSGLPFSYIVKRKRNDEYSGELIVSRKEGSKTLTRSSILLAFHKVLEEIETKKDTDQGGLTESFSLPEYKGPKAIGQIFGISYVYSLFWEWKLIKVPEKVEQKLKGK